MKVPPRKNPGYGPVIGCGLRYMHQIWQSDRSMCSIKYAFQQHSIQRPGSVLLMHVQEC